jgi:prepilin-type N-terminal cleavage/methylation domain-containing protein
MKKFTWLRRKQTGRPFFSAGFSLVEMVIALAVIAVTFIGLIGLLGVGLASNQTSSEQLGATNIADSIIADLRSTPSYIISSSGDSVRFGIPLPKMVTTAAAPLAGAAATVLYFDNLRNFIVKGGAAPSNAVYAANVYSAQVSSVGPSDLVRVTVSWPAAATAAPAGSLEVVTQFQIH